MQQKPYSREPDVFALTVPSDVQGLSLRFFESDWGVTEEQLCFYEGTLLGVTCPTCASTDTVISLLPKLDERRLYPWPSSESFLQALMAITGVSRRWLLRCEQDADQKTVLMTLDDAEVGGFIKLALSYCEGVGSACPNFMAVNQYPMTSLSK